ncbi:flagellar biosynthetic protein FliO [Hyalangium rubrum]|uniref:Flagellar biosynthetic protein FliO n=1 Tax=Hyalangium rubrum TaxID=3103134 RepID=A0ABU5H6V8_9BACT|nr:flagellar biosynthetic protein FliO [Hyalangium sp. s54d21]MDY7228614.1 flagellar biosynthetic protein FliO [Hyalangium sp. s54d21]
MLSSLSPRHRLLLAGGLILGLAALAPLGGLSASGVARWLLGAIALAGLGWWLRRRSTTGPRFSLPERLRVISRAALSQRCGLALVEADGRSFLVAFGDSFAEIREAPMPNRAPSLARRMVLRRRSAMPRKGAMP